MPMPCRINRLPMPPGFPVQTERKLFYTALAAAQLWSLGFLINFFDARKNCYIWRGSNRYLKPEAVMPRFFELAAGPCAGFAVAALCMAALILWHIHYYYEGSRSVYLMRRLPRQGVFYASIVSSPLCLGAAILLAGAITLGLYALIYRIFCPPLCVPLRPWAL